MCATRLPFRFGISTMTEAPMLTAALEVATEFGTVTGYSAELLVPKWFAKNPTTDVADDNRDLMRAAVRAHQVMRDHESPDATAFQHWMRAQMQCVEAAGEGTPRLVAMFGVALVERAMIDATCRAAGKSFHGALTEDLFRVRFGAIEKRLAGWSAADLGEPTDSVRVRHTVGLVDALEPIEVPADAHRGDDHPLSLVDDIRAYGLDCFKLKVSGNEVADLARLEMIASLTPPGASFTIDGNEQYPEPGALADVLDELEERGHADAILGGLLAIEQPVARARTFDPEAAEGIARLRSRAPVIIDEADADLGAYPRARELGYGGVSMKACKGVFRALLNRARIEADGEGLQSAEDLTNLPVLPLHQDLAVVASLGLPHVERNGHHYFRGQSHLSAVEREHLAQHHASLYQRTADGDLWLDIQDGRLDLRSLQRSSETVREGEGRTTAGFGYDGPIDMENGTAPQL
ncbi:hypothetical protein Poly30_14490 [Planctomycetes bacterium Poly30]|uniref:Mandelate racemase/muconate lactonizing enzyme C-terminal domain-containing protein n=2 Tax=Saltatorellus ferox TaxID=2528018 RepID=A0A518EPD9_9BACT|nr:hypothetical protein Poly30_14490 [Planctomycetes bacterium Poly30]